MVANSLVKSILPLLIRLWEFLQAAEFIGESNKKIVKIVGNACADFSPITHSDLQSLTVAEFPIVTISAGLLRVIQALNVQSKVVTCYIVTHTF